MLLSTTTHATHSEAASHASQGIQPSVLSWNVVVDALGKAGQLPLMMDAYERMRAAATRPDVFTFTSMIAGAGSAGDVPMAEQLWDDMRSRALSRMSGPTPHGSTATRWPARWTARKPFS